MTRVAQVGHVAAKDFRESKWLLVVYTVVVAWATPSAIAPRHDSGAGGLDIAWVLLPLVGMLVMASVVQGDSPTRPDSPWATRPLYPSAVLVAKVAFAAVGIVLLPAMAQMAGLSAHAVRAANIPGMVGESIWIYAQLLLAAALIAAVTSDLRAVFVALLATFLGEVVLVAFVTAKTYGVVRFPGVGPVSAVLKIIGVVGAFSLLLFLYRTRDGRRRAVAAAVAGAALLFATLGSPRVSPLSALNASTPVVSVTALRTDSPGFPGFSVNLDLDAIDTAAAERLVLVQPTVTLRLEDGKSMALESNPQTDLRKPGLPEISGAGWSTDNARGEPRLPLGIMLTKDEQSELAKHRVTRMTIDGLVTRWHPHVAANVPLREGESFFAADRRYTVSTWTHLASQATLDVEATWVDQKPSSAPPLMRNLWRLGLAEPDIVLFNDRETRPPMSMSKGGSGGTSWLVLPGADVHVSGSQFGMRLGRDSNAAPANEAWFAGLRLMVVEWIPTGAFRVRAEVSNP